MGSMPDYVLPQSLFQDNPTVRFERRHTQTYSEIIVLITNLLELVDTSFPQRRELDLYPLPSDNPVSFSIMGGCNIETFCCTPARHKLFPNLPDLTRGSRSNPGKRTSSPGVLCSLASVIRFERTCDRSEQQNISIRNLRAHLDVPVKKVELRTGSAGTPARDVVWDRNPPIRFCLRHQTAWP